MYHSRAGKHEHDGLIHKTNTPTYAVMGEMAWCCNPVCI